VHCTGGWLLNKVQGGGVCYSLWGAGGWYVLLCVATGMSVWYTECVLTYDMTYALCIS